MIDAWGPYYRWPRTSTEYVHEVYPLARGIVQDADGSLRTMTREELAPINDAFERSFDQIFRETP